MMKGVKKAVLYARVSSKEQEREGFSIPAQRKLLHAYALENGYDVVAEFREAETAKKAGRAEFQKMIAYLDAHPDVQDVLVEKTDRLYRNFKDYTRLDVEQRDLHVHLVKEGEILSKDSKSHEKFIHGIKMLMAKNYTDNLSEEVKKGQTEKAEQGIWPSAAPFGYRNRLSDHTVEPDPARAQYVVRAFELMAGRQHSLGMIAQDLSDAGARTKRINARLSKSHVQAILTREIYYGQVPWNGKIYDGKHTPLISKALFDRVQEAMGKRQKPKVVKHESVYGGVLTCGHCGCAITPDHKTKRSGKHYVYYRCTNGKKSCGSVVYLREEKLEEAFAAALKQIEITPEAVELTRKALLQSAEQEREFHEQAISNLTQEVATLQRRIERCYTDHIDGKISTDEWESRTAAWKVEQSDLRLKLSAHDRADHKYMQGGVKLLELASRAHKLFTTTMTSAEKREIVDLVLSNPRIEDGSVRYDYKMPFAMMVNSTETEKWLAR